MAVCNDDPSLRCVGAISGLVITARAFNPAPSRLHEIQLLRLPSRSHTVAGFSSPRAWATLQGRHAAAPLFAESTTTTTSTTTSDVALLSSLTSSRTQEEEKNDIVSDIFALRQSSPDAYQQKLDDLLAEVDKVPTWLPSPIPLPSKRLRFAALGRLVEATMSSSETTGADRRRSALSMLLRALPKAGSVRALEREVLRGQRKKGPTMAEMKQWTPAGLETPRYDVLDARPTWEVRRYEPFSTLTRSMDVVATTSAGGEEEASAGKGSGTSAFRELAGYIFGGNKEEKKMAMTTPVLTTLPELGQSSSPSSKTMSFVLPSAYWEDGAASAPSKLDTASVTVGPSVLTPVAPTTTATVRRSSRRSCSRSRSRSRSKEVEPGRDVAVLWFTGVASSAAVAVRSAELTAAIDADPAWARFFGGGGAATRCSARNDPALPWRRRTRWRFLLCGRAEWVSAARGTSYMSGVWLLCPGLGLCPGSGLGAGARFIVNVVTSTRSFDTAPRSRALRCRENGVR